MWWRMLALFRKEALLLLKDRKVRMVVLLPPLIQILIFAFAATFEVKHVALGVWNEDASETSSELVRSFAQSPAFRVIGITGNPDEVRDWIDGQKAAAVLHIGPRFYADLATGRRADVQLILDGRRSNTALIVQNYAAEIIAGFGRATSVIPAFAGPSVEVRAWFNPNLESQWFILPGLNAVVVMVMVMLITALSVARERELGTIDQLLVTPLRSFEIIVGKVLPGLAVGLAEAFLIQAVTTHAFHVPFLGSLTWFTGGFVVFLTSAIGIGLAISTIAATQQQAILGVFTFLAPAVILSGFATPIANMPGWCQFLSLGNPIRYMLELVRSLYLRDPDPASILQLIWPMTVIGLVTLSGATVLFRQRVS
jgi:ABC-2 type transport system permease protein